MLTDAPRLSSRQYQLPIVEMNLLPGLDPKHWAPFVVVGEPKPAK